MRRNDQNLETLILQKVPNLPSNQKRVAEYLLTHKNLVALLPIKALAAEANVSEASIVRFAQTLGFHGYKELKEKMSHDLKNQLSPTQKFQVASLEKSTTDDTLRLVARNVIDNIQGTLNAIEPETFSRIVDNIIQANKICCFGVELSSHLSRLFTFLLRLYTYDAQHLSLDFLHFRDQIALLSEKDLLIAFSFSPYSRETIEALQFAKNQNIPSIVFTDKKTAPAVEHATHCLTIKTDNILFSNSIGAVAVLINAIITELNFRDSERTLQALRRIETNIQDERYFIQI